jgi:hypothetical protein
MTRQEIRRFSRAYRWAVAKGYFDVFNDEHFNAMRNRHHGADVLAVAPPAVFPGETPEWGFRLLSRSCYCRGRRSCGTSSCSAGRDRTKEKPGFWTRRRAFEQVRHGSNIQLLSYPLVTVPVGGAIGGIVGGIGGAVGGYFFGRKVTETVYDWASKRGCLQNERRET